MCVCFFPRSSWNTLAAFIYSSFYFGYSIRPFFYIAIFINSQVDVETGFLLPFTKKNHLFLPDTCQYLVIRVVRLKFTILISVTENHEILLWKLPNYFWLFRKLHEKGFDSEVLVDGTQAPFKKRFGGITIKPSYYGQPLNVDGQTKDQLS